MKAIYRFTPFISVAILMLGTGLFGTLIPLKLKIDNHSDFIIGGLGSIYYFGMLLGSISVLKFLNKVGPSRTFIIAALVLAIVTIIPGFQSNLILWSVSRFIGGYCLAWLYIVVESWVLNISNNKNRGKNLAIYMIVLYLGQSGGQLFLGVTNIDTITPFVLAVVLTVFSIVPITIIKGTMPHIKIPDALGFAKLYKISPRGMIGCIVSGLVLASLYSLLPVYFKDNGYDVKTVATMMSVLIAGGVLLQYPFGLISDHFDRRIVMILLCVGGIVMSGAIILADYFGLKNEILICALIFLFGGITFSIYPISLSHTCDHVDNNYVVEATQGMLLAYGIGCVLGPVSISLATWAFGPNGLFYSVIIDLLFMVIFMMMRIRASNKAIAIGGEYVGSTPHVELVIGTDSEEKQ